MWLLTFTGIFGLCVQHPLRFADAAANVLPHAVGEEVENLRRRVFVDVTHVENLPPDLLFRVRRRLLPTFSFEFYAKQGHDYAVERSATSAEVFLGGARSTATGTTGTTGLLAHDLPGGGTTSTTSARGSRSSSSSSSFSPTVGEDHHHMTTASTTLQVVAAKTCTSLDGPRCGLGTETAEVGGAIPRSVVQEVLGVRREPAAVDVGNEEEYAADFRTILDLESGWGVSDGHTLEQMKEKSTSFGGDVVDGGDHVVNVSSSTVGDLQLSRLDLTRLGADWDAGGNVNGNVGARFILPRPTTSTVVQRAWLVRKVSLKKAGIGGAGKGGTRSSRGELQEQEASENAAGHDEDVESSGGLFAQLRSSLSGPPAAGGSSSSKGKAKDGFRRSHPRTVDRVVFRGGWVLLSSEIMNKSSLQLTGGVHKANSGSIRFKSAVLIRKLTVRASRLANHAAVIVGRNRGQNGRELWREVVYRSCTVDLSSSQGDEDGGNNLGLVAVDEIAFLAARNIEILELEVAPAAFLGNDGGSGSSQTSAAAFLLSQTGTVVLDHAVNANAWPYLISVSEMVAKKLSLKKKKVSSCSAAEDFGGGEEGGSSCSCFSRGMKALEAVVADEALLAQIPRVFGGGGGGRTKNSTAEHGAAEDEPRLREQENPTLGNFSTSSATTDSDHGVLVHLKRHRSHVASSAAELHQMLKERPAFYKMVVAMRDLPTFQSFEPDLKDDLKRINRALKEGLPEKENKQSEVYYAADRVFSEWLLFLQNAFLSKETISRSLRDETRNKEQEDFVAFTNFADAAGEDPPDTVMDAVTDAVLGANQRWFFGGLSATGTGTPNWRAVVEADEQFSAVEDELLKGGKTKKGSEKKDEKEKSISASGPTTRTNKEQEQQEGARTRSTAQESETETTTEDEDLFPRAASRTRIPIPGLFQVSATGAFVPVFEEVEVPVFEELEGVNSASEDPFPSGVVKSDDARKEEEQAGAMEDEKKPEQEEEEGAPEAATSTLPMEEQGSSHSAPRLAEHEAPAEADVATAWAPPTTSAVLDAGEVVSGTQEAATVVKVLHNSKNSAQKAPVDKAAVREKLQRKLAALVAEQHLYTRP